MNRDEYQRRNKQYNSERKRKFLWRHFWKWRPIWWVTPSDRFAFFVALFTAVLAVVAGLQTCVLRNQLNEMQAERRPWIGPPAEIKITVSTSGVVTFTQVFKNVGRTPTTGFYIDGTIIAENGLEWKAGFDICKIALDAVKSHGLPPLSSIPGNDWALDVAAMPTPQRNHDTFTVESLKEMNNPTLVGCVLYGSQFDTGIHKTQYFSRFIIDGESVRVDFIYAGNAD